MKNKLKKICLIGGNGFIGVNLSNIFSIKKKNFFVIDKLIQGPFKHKTILCDIRNEKGLFNKIDNTSVIVNLAAEHRDNVKPLSLYHEINVNGAKNICEVASKKNISSIIFTSSVAVYGFNNEVNDEESNLNPFNEYGKTKAEAEKIYKNWQKQDPKNRKLVIIRPTVVFGKGNRGNVFNLFSQIVTRKFVMIGNGKNIKSMAYVENLASFIDYSLSLKEGIHIFNYVDKPDLSMNELVNLTKETLNFKNQLNLKLPYFIGITIGYIFDLFSFLLSKKLVVSSIRIKKFCSNSIISTKINNEDFIPPHSLINSIKNTIKHEFRNDNKR